MGFTFAYFTNLINYNVTYERRVNKSWFNIFVFHEAEVTNLKFDLFILIFKFEVYGVPKAKLAFNKIVHNF